MKKTVFILSALFFIASCGSSDETGFLSPSKPTGDDTDKGLKLVQVEIKVGVSDKGSSMKRPKSGKSKDSPSTKGGESEGQDTDAETASPSDESDEKGIGLPYSEEVTFDGRGKKKGGKKVDVLFYLGYKGHGTCWKHLGRSIENSGFFSHLNNFNWQTAAAFSHESELYHIREKDGSRLYVGGNAFGVGAKSVYVLKKEHLSSSESDESLQETITLEYTRNLHYDDGRGSEKSRDENLRGVPVFLPLHQKAPEDTLVGLSKLLKKNSEGFARNNSKTFVVMVDSSYYYTTDEWQDFVRNREDVRFIALSSRIGVVSNHLPVLENEGNFEWIACGDDQVAKNLAKYIKKAAH